VQQRHESVDAERGVTLTMRIGACRSWRALGAALVLALNARATTAQMYDSTMFRGLQWRNVVPNSGGRTTPGVGVPGNPRIYYMGATGGGVWKTEDACTTWRNVSDGFFKT